MIRPCASLIAFLLLSGTATAFSGYPYADNYIWQDVPALMGALLTGTVERCLAMGVTPPEIIETWACSAGTSNQVLTGTFAGGFLPDAANGQYVFDGGTDWVNDNGWIIWDSETPSGWYLFDDAWDHIYLSDTGPTSLTWTAWIGGDTAGYTFDATVTNLVLLSTNIVVTNQVGPFAYTAAGSNYTAYPSLTQGFIEALDDAIEAIIAASVCTNYDASGYDDWFTNMVYTFDTNGVCTATNYMTDFPMNSKAGLFDRESIGYVTNRTWYSFDPATNTHDYITGGDAYWTRQPATTSNWLLAESVYTGATSWVFRDIGAFSTRFYDSTAYPSLVYTSGGTNALAAPISITVTGLVINLPDQSTSAASEVVTVSAINSTNALTNHWYSIATLSITNAGASTGDWAAVTWLGDIALYAGAPYRLHIEDLDERVRALKACMYSRRTAAAGTNALDGTYVGAGWGVAGVSNTWAASSGTPSWPGAVVDTDVEPTYTYPVGESGNLNTGGGTYYDGWEWYNFSHTGSRGPSASGYPIDFIWTHRYTNEVEWTSVVNGSFDTAHHLDASIILSDGVDVVQRVEVTVPSIAVAGGRQWGTYYALDGGGGSSSAHYELLSAQWLSAYDKRTRKSGTIKVTAIDTNTTCDIDLYMVGMWPSSEHAFEPDDIVAYDWNGYGLIGSQFSSPYNAASSSNFVWAPEFGLDSLSPTGSYVFISTQSSNQAALYEWTNALSATLPYASDTNLVQKGWAIRAAKTLHRWHFEYQ